MSLGRNINDLTLTGSLFNTDKVYIGRAPYGTSDDFAVLMSTLVDNIVGAGSWEVITTNTTLVPNNNYFVNSSSPIILTLPSSFNVADTIRIIGVNTGLWTINQNTGQGILIGSHGTTTGTGGHVASTNGFDQLSIIGVISNTVFASLGAPLGSLTVI